MSFNLYTVRCEALFASTVQRSECPSTRRVHDEITETVRRLGSQGCAAVVAQEFGDHPETAIVRMRWAREEVGRLATACAVPTDAAPHRLDPDGTRLAA
jgi:hypothetical protein